MELLIIVAFLVVGGIFFFKMDHVHRQKISWFESVHEDYKKSLNSFKSERTTLKERVSELEEIERSFNVFSDVISSLEKTLNIEYVDRFKEVLRNLDREPWQPVDKAEFAELLWIYMPMYVLNNPSEFTKRFTHESISLWVDKNVEQIYMNYMELVNDGNLDNFDLAVETDDFTPFWFSGYFAETIFIAVNQFDEGTLKTLSGLIEQE